MDRATDRFDTVAASTPLVRGFVTLVSLALSLMVAGCFPQKAGPRLAHFAVQAPAVGDLAPDFDLTDLEGRRVSLSSLVGEMPIVLQLGSHSCPVYRYRRHWMRGLAEDYAGRAHFLIVYTLEAHPTGSVSPYADREWRSLVNRMTRVSVEQTETAEQRLERAAWSHARLKLNQEMLVDDVDNGVWQDYGSASSPGFVIDLEGRVASRDVWLDPKSIRETLERLLAEEKQ